MKIKTERTPNPNVRKDFIAIKVSQTERAMIEQLAKRHAGGNISAFVRYAALNFKAKP